MTDEKIIEVMAEAARRALMDIEAVWLAAWIKRLGPDATLDHSDQTELHRIRQRLWEATDLTAITAAGYEIVEKGQAEAVDEREALAMRLAKAEALAEAAKECRKLMHAFAAALVAPTNSLAGCAGDEPTIIANVTAASGALDAALSAFQQGGDGWRPEADMRADLGEHISDTAKRAFSRAMDKGSTVVDHNDLRFLVRCYRPTETPS